MSLRHVPHKTDTKSAATRCVLKISPWFVVIVFPPSHAHIYLRAVDEEDAAKLNKKGSCEVQYPRGLGGSLDITTTITFESTPYACTPDSVSEDLDSSTHLPVSRDFVCQSLRSAPNADRVLSANPTAQKPGLTPSPLDFADKCSDGQQGISASKHNKMLPMPLVTSGNNSRRADAANYPLSLSQKE